MFLKSNFQENLFDYSSLGVQYETPQLYWHVVAGSAKGQLISKGNFSVFNSPKKQTYKC